MVHKVVIRYFHPLRQLAADTEVLLRRVAAVAQAAVLVGIRLAYPVALAQAVKEIMVGITDLVDQYKIRAAVAAVLAQQEQAA
jgi:hypothetical protein